MSNVTTPGSLLVDSVLPQGLRGGRTLDAPATKDVMRDIAQNHPDEYRDIAQRLMTIANQAAQSSGGYSYGPDHLLPTPGVQKRRQRLEAQLQTVLDDDKLTEEQREQMVVKIMGRGQQEQTDSLLDESLAENNPVAYQIASGAKGSKNNLGSLRGSDMLYVDHRDRVIPFPVLNNYSGGLSPAEYWASAYGARKGVVDNKLHVAEAGFFGKQLGQISHRAVITGVDRDKPEETLRGLPVDVNDDESEGALLAQAVGGYQRNDVITPKMLGALRRKGIKRLLVRSPIVSGPPDGGIYARDAGVREFGRLPVQGENVGMTASQALSEGLAQGALSSRHAGGVAGDVANKRVTGLSAIDQFVQVPKTFKGGAAHALRDGTVQKIEAAPAGGSYVVIDGERHYVGAGFKVNVRRGDKVEAGDVISEGLPNPAIVVHHKGIGEGRRYFVEAGRNAYRDAAVKGHRRNLELLARGLINHVRLTDEVGDFAPGDIVPYSVLEHGYKPRYDSELLTAKQAVGQYLEKPYLHYSIGTQVKPSMLKDFDDFGVKHLHVHKEPPPFEPEMVRGMANLQHDPDWLVRMFGSGLKSSLLDSVHRGGTSDETGTSFVPGLARAVDFGRTGKVVTPKEERKKVNLS